MDHSSSESPGQEKPDPNVKLQEVLATDFESAKANVCLAAVQKGDDLPDYRTINIHKDVEDFRGFAADKIRSLKDKHEAGNLLLHPYDPGSKPDAHEIEYIQESEHAAVQHQLSSLNSFADLPDYQGSEDFINNLRFYVIFVERPGRSPLRCFRFYTSKMELQRSSRFGLVFKDGTYDKVREPLLLFDRHIDCISCDGVMFILNQDKFQKIFRFFERVEKAAAKVLRSIKKQIPIHPFNDFAEMCKGHLQKMAKLNNISRRPYFGRITIDDIKKVRKEFSVSVKIEEVDGEERLIYEPDNKWTILRVLDDGYLRSVMTENVYEVTGKRVYEAD